jgi:flagellar motor switch protein FliN
MHIETKGESMEDQVSETDRAPVRRAQLEDLQTHAAGAPIGGALDLIYDVKVRLTMSVGAAQLTIGELYALKEGAVLKLDKATGDPVDVFLDSRLVARGELMVAGEHFAVRITELGDKA